MHVIRNRRNALIVSGAQPLLRYPTKTDLEAATKVAEDLRDKYRDDAVTHMTTDHTDGGDHLSLLEANRNWQAMEQQQARLTWLRGLMAEKLYESQE